MSDQIKPHNLVLRNGRVEEVKTIFAFNSRYSTVGADAYSNCPSLSDATRIGSTLPPENWRVHTESERPADVGAEDVVEVFMDWHTGPEDANSKYRARSWGWEKGCGIVAYRIVQRAIPSASELRVVAAEMRDYYPPYDTTVAATWLRAWANRIDPPEPEPDPRIAVVQSFTACTDDYAKRILVALDAAK